MAQSRDQYKEIAEQYKESKGLSFRRSIEEYSLFQMLGGVQGRRVTDLACGDGTYTRKLKAAGAAAAVGLDLSAEMIALAEAEERQNPQGCTYLRQDAAQSGAPMPPPADVVTAMYLLNYAESREQLRAFCNTAFALLKPGGRFVGVNDNINNPPLAGGDFSQYGFVKQCPNPVQEGDAIAYKITLENGESFEFNNYYLKPETYEQAFARAGFADFVWHNVALEPAQAGNPFWDAFMHNPPIVGFTAQRPRA